MTNANHNPVAAINGNAENILTIDASPGDTVSLDASKSYDPDLGQGIDFVWWIYNEAGTCDAGIEIKDPTSPTIQFTIPEKTESSELHFILELRDHSELAQMYDYRRMVIRINYTT